MYAHVQGHIGNRGLLMDTILVHSSLFLKTNFSLDIQIEIVLKLIPFIKYWV